jgi:hypothetical protein
MCGHRRSLNTTSFAADGVQGTEGVLGTKSDEGANHLVAMIRIGRGPLNGVFAAVPADDEEKARLNISETILDQIRPMDDGGASPRE